MILANLISFEKLIPFAIFGGFSLLAWWLMNVFAAGKSRATERLDELKNPQARHDQQALSALKKSDTMTKVLEKASPALAKPLTPKSEAEQGKLKTKLSTAGFRTEMATTIFLALKFAGLLIGFFVGAGTIIGIRGMSLNNLLFSIGIAIVFFCLPDLVVAFMGKSRKEKIFLGLPDTLDLMVVCVEAGLGLDQAMRKVSEEMGNSHPVIAAEFKLSNGQLQWGRPRNEVLHELGLRTGVADLRSLAGVLIQADKFGSSIAQALRVQSDSMRTRRRQLAEEKAAKTAVKLIFPLVLFIFPGIFVVLVGPAAITMVRELFPMMSAN